MKKGMKTFAKTLLIGTIAVTAAGSALAVSPKAEAASAAKQVQKQVKKIVKKQAAKGSKKTKLLKLYNYVSYHVLNEDGTVKDSNYKYGQADYRDVTKLNSGKMKKSWTAKYALSMIKKKQGSCYHYAALYGYLAKQATGYTVRVGVGSTTGYATPESSPTQRHAWVEVKIKGKWYICDPMMYQYSANYKTKSATALFLRKRSSSAMKKTYCKYKDAVYYTIKF